MLNKQSILFRSVFSFFSTSIKSALVLFTSIVLARELGPELYGIYAFLIATFIAIKTFAGATLSGRSQLHEVQRSFSFSSKTPYEASPGHRLGNWSPAIH